MHGATMAAGVVRRLKALEYLNVASQYESHSRAVFDFETLDMLHELPALTFVAMVSASSRKGHFVVLPRPSCYRVVNVCQPQRNAVGWPTAQHVMYHDEGSLLQDRTVLTIDVISTGG